MEETITLDEKVRKLMPLSVEQRAVLSVLGYASLNSSFHDPPATKLDRVAQDVLTGLESTGLIARHRHDLGWVITDAGMYAYGLDWTYPQDSGPRAVVRLPDGS